MFADDLEQLNTVCLQLPWSTISSSDICNYIVWNQIVWDKENDRKKKSCITPQELWTQFMFCCVLFMINFAHVLQGYFTGIGAIIWLPQCLWSDPDEYGSNEFITN